MIGRRVPGLVLLVLVLLTAGPWVGPARDALGHSATEDAGPLAGDHVGGLAPSLEAWISGRSANVSLGPRETRPSPAGVFARTQDELAAPLAGLGSAPTFCSPLGSPLGLCWSRPVRGPPAGRPAH